MALIGLRGAGKSTLGRILAERMGWSFVELNREIERENGLSVAEIFAIYGQETYRRLEQGALRRLADLMDAPAELYSLRHSRGYEAAGRVAAGSARLEGSRAESTAALAALQAEEEAAAGIAGALAARAEREAERRERLLQLEGDHPGLHHGDPLGGIDPEDPMSRDAFMARVDYPTTKRYIEVIEARYQYYRDTANEPWWKQALRRLYYHR